MKRLIATLLCITMMISLTSCAYVEGILQQLKPNEFSSVEEVQAAREEIYQEYLDSISDRESELSDGEITIENETMELTMQIIGEPEENGYPIYIALHGGGVFSETVQQEQYEIMTNYGYVTTIDSGIYIAVKSLVAQCDEHSVPHALAFYDRIIEDAVAFYNGDPNRVYLTGFSSGGYGVYTIAPQYADRLAAANASAGRPSYVKLENLYNLPFCVQVGEDDDMFDNSHSILSAVFDGWLEDYNDYYGGGFEHSTYIHQNGTHSSGWSDYANNSQRVVSHDSLSDWLISHSSAEYVSVRTGAIYWFNQYTRNPYPERVVWATNMDSISRRSKAFYWLDRDYALNNSTVVASYSSENNTVTIEDCNAAEGTLKIYLNTQMMDLFSNVTVIVNGTEYRVRPILSSQIMESTLYARGDINYMFDAEIDIHFENGNVTVEAVGEHVDEYDPDGYDNLITWNEDGLFLVNGCIFELSYEEVEEKLGVELAPLQDWPYWDSVIAAQESIIDWDYDLQWTYLDGRDDSPVFMFHDNKLVIVYFEGEGHITDALVESAASVFYTYDVTQLTRNTNNLYEYNTTGNGCVFIIKDEGIYFNGAYHVRQMYTSQAYSGWYICYFV